jgi:hypothetical protein
MNKYFILCLATNVLVGFTAASPSPFDPALTYQMDDRRPLPSYIFEGEVPPEEEDEQVATPGGVNIVDDIWGTLNKKQQVTKKPKRPRQKPVKISTTQPQYSLFLLFCDESPRCSILKEIWKELPPHLITRGEEMHKGSGRKKRL